MPIYEYHCESCGHEFEAMQKITDEPIRKCEGCGKMKAKRSISRTSFVLKGSGWYVTDYGGANASNRPKAASTSSDGNKEKETPKKAANE
jgi:putative FmdB family regulatory protein